MTSSPSTKPNPSTARPDPLKAVLHGLERLAVMQGQLIRQLIQRQHQP